MANERTLREWMTIFNGVYAKPNANRVPEQFWIGAAVHCSAIAEGLRTICYEDILREAAHAFEWMCAFATKINGLPATDVFCCTDNLSSMVAIKYPGVCGHCERKPCGCDSIEADEKSDKAGHYDRLRNLWRHLDHNSYSFRDWRDVFWGIYAHNTHLLTPSALGFHFLEEVGEEDHAIRLLTELRSVVDKELVDPAFIQRISSIETLVDECNNYWEVVTGEEKVDITSCAEEDLRKRLTNAKIHVLTELADTFAWLCSILNKIERISESNGFSLPSISEAIEMEYFDGTAVARCPTCKNPGECSCLFAF